MNILLVESHFRSRSWYLAIKGIEQLFIVSVMPEEKKRFLADGVPGEQILDLRYTYDDGSVIEEKRDYLSSVENEMGFCFNEIVLMDRTMREKKSEYVVLYLYYITKKIHEFIVENDIRLVFIEPTWTHEIVVCKICDYLKIPTMAPVKDKLLPDRFMVFHGYMHDFHYQRMDNHDAESLAEQVISTVIGNKKPQYFSKFNARNKITFSKWTVLYDITKAAVLGIYNPNIQPKLMVAIKRKVISIFRAWFYSYFNNFVTIDEILSPYVLVTLHLQPEASIDVVGAKFSNQTEFVRQLVRTAPSSHLLLIKEHPHAFGDRKPDFYEFLDAMPNVKILAPFEDSRKAILGADLVVSTTGTSSLEAAIMGVPAVTAVEMFYKQLMVEPSFDPACNNLSDLLIKAKKWRGQIYTIEMVYDAIKRIQASTFSGNSGDFKTDPHVMSDENILKLRSMFLEIIENHKDIL